MSTTAAIADSVLTDAHLHALGLVPLGTETTVESVALAPEDRSACVVRTDAATIIVDGGEQLMALFDASAVALPGTVHVAAAVSSVDYSAYRVFVDGQSVRHLEHEDGEVTVDEGDASPAEDVFRLPSEDEELEGEIDGDILIQSLPQLAGFPVDIFTLTGAAYAAADSGDTADDSAGDSAGPNTSGSEQHDPKSRKRGFFGRLFGA
ncbi:hypothetical protein [Brevibacterium yomogidense]|nr:hypothetical protein [Brevibacterium yomogidense]